jgi:glycine cleavage system protein P-like pyridoxal-binding family
MLIFDRSREGRACTALFPQTPADIRGLPGHLLRQTPPPLPEVAELDVVRHYTRLSQKNFSVDTHFYPLGSCTMKYNPKMANVLARQAGFDTAFPARRAAHEFILSVQRQKKEYHVGALDFAKRLLDYGFHAPTVYFPLLIPECLMVEPTETENKETLDAFVDAMAVILKEAAEKPDRLKQAPRHTPIRRLDEVRAARHPDLAWKPASGTTSRR